MKFNNERPTRPVANAHEDVKDNKEIVAKTGVLLKDIVSVVDAMLAKAKVKNRTELMRWWNDEGNNSILL